MMDRVAEQRRERRLLALPYPEQCRYDHPYPVSEERFYPPASRRELARIQLQAPLVRNSEEPASATLWLEVLAARPADELERPIASVSITIVAHVPPRLPTFEDPLPSLELIVDGRSLTYRIRPDDVDMQIARQRSARAPGSSEIGLRISTEDFLAFAQAKQAEGRIGAVRFLVPPPTREALLDFASRMQPVGR